MKWWPEKKFNIEPIDKHAFLLNASFDTSGLYGSYSIISENMEHILKHKNIKCGEVADIYMNDFGFHVM